MNNGSNSDLKADPDSSQAAEHGSAFRFAKNAIFAEIRAYLSSDRGSGHITEGNKKTKQPLYLEVLSIHKQRLHELMTQYTIQYNSATSRYSIAHQEDHPVSVQQQHWKYDLLGLINKFSFNCCDDIGYHKGVGRCDE